METFVCIACSAGDHEHCLGGNPGPPDVMGGDQCICEVCADPRKEKDVGEQHKIHVERRGSQRFVPVCSCGWEGRNRKGTEFWQSSGALNAAFIHQEDVGLPMALDFPLIDLSPETRRHRRRSRV